MNIKVNRDLAVKVLSVVDAGLSSGIGTPTPGKMCVEAAVCYAMGLPHSDRPTCVSPVLRWLKIALNDNNWSSRQARAKGMRRLAVAQLGSVGTLDEKAFLAHVVDMTIRKIVPRGLRAAATLHPQQEHKAKLEAAAQNCEHAASDAASDAARAASAASATSYAAARAASAASDAASYAARATSASMDGELTFFAEEVVQILIAMKAPGTQWLNLTEG